MPQQPNRLYPDTPLEDNLALINDNADKAVQDISDLGAKFSGIASFHVTIAAGGFLPPFTISSVDAASKYVPGKLQVVPRFEIYEDNDLNALYLLGYSNSQSKKAIVSAWVQRTSSVGSIADVVISIQNTDTASHVYYVYVDESYQDSPHTGTFR